MKLYAPTYYKEFECKKEKCKRNCCIGWEIYIDEKTAEKYRTAKGSLWDSVREGLLALDDGSVTFRMKNGRCPNLTDGGLCRIISEAGEEMICDICKSHPRFYNVTQRGAEVGVGLACEAAAELILSNDLEITPISEISATEEEIYYDITENREKALAHLREKSTSYKEKTQELKKCFSIANDGRTFLEWADLYLTLENLDPIWRVYINEAKRLKKDFSLPSVEEGNILSRLTSYFLYRYMPKAEDSIHERAIIAFSVHAPLMIYSIYAANKDKITLLDAAILYSAEIEYSEENVERLISEFDTSFDF